MTQQKCGDRICQSCKHWFYLDDVEENWKVGQCRRSPPVLNPLKEARLIKDHPDFSDEWIAMMATDFPATESADYCSEWIAMAGGKRL